LQQEIIFERKEMQIKIKG